MTDFSSRIPSTGQAERPLALRARLQSLRQRAARQRTLRGQRGVTMLELIAGLAIIAIIIVGALSLVSQAETSAKTVEMLRGIGGIRANLRGLYSGQTGYTVGNLNLEMINAKAIPENWIANKTTGELRHTYNGAVNIMGTATNATLELINVPKEACIRIISQQAGTDWLKVVASNEAIFPATVTAAVTACGNNDNTNMLFTTQH